MRAIRGSYRQIAGAAEAALTVMPVHQAVAVAEIAVAQDLIGRGNFLLQQAAAITL
jgi:hypothetical protein